MEPIKTTKNIEFDVIYADGTRRHVAEGVLFEANGNTLTFHNGTDRLAVLLSVAEAAAEAVSRLKLPVEMNILLVSKIAKYLTPKEAEVAERIEKRIAARKNKASDLPTTFEGGTQ